MNIETHMANLIREQLNLSIANGEADVPGEEIGEGGMMAAAAGAGPAAGLASDASAEEIKVIASICLAQTIEELIADWENDEKLEIYKQDIVQTVQGFEVDKAVNNGGWNTVVNNLTLKLKGFSKGARTTMTVVPDGEQCKQILQYSRHPGVAALILDPNLQHDAETQKMQARRVLGCGENELVNVHSPPGNYNDTNSNISLQSSFIQTQDGAHSIFGSVQGSDAYRNLNNSHKGKCYICDQWLYRGETPVELAGEADGVVRPPISLAAATNHNLHIDHDNNKIGSTVMECEHILAFMQGIILYDVYNIRNAELTEGERRHFETEYFWSHRCCNQKKDNIPLITFDIVSAQYKINEENIKRIVKAISNPGNTALDKECRALVMDPEPQAVDRLMREPKLIALKVFANNKLNERVNYLGVQDGIHVPRDVFAIAKILDSFPQTLLKEAFMTDEAQYKLGAVQQQWSETFKQYNKKKIELTNLIQQYANVKVTNLQAGRHRPMRAEYLADTVARLEGELTRQAALDLQAVGKLNPWDEIKIPDKNFESITESMVAINGQIEKLSDYITDLQNKAEAEAHAAGLGPTEGGGNRGKHGNSPLASASALQAPATHRVAKGQRARGAAGAWRNRRPNPAWRAPGRDNIENRRKNQRGAKFAVAVAGMQGRNNLMLRRNTRVSQEKRDYTVARRNNLMLRRNTRAADFWGPWGNPPVEGLFEWIFIYGGRHSIVKKTLGKIKLMSKVVQRKLIDIARDAALRAAWPGAHAGPRLGHDGAGWAKDQGGGRTKTKKRKTMKRKTRKRKPNRRKTRKRKLRKKSIKKRK